MVLQKRLDYGFNGYQFPPTPRAARSARRRGSCKRRHEDSQVCAFDLLAFVAENLLLEKAPSPSSDNSSANNDKCEVINKNVKQESRDEATQLKVETHDQESPSRDFLNSDVVSHVRDQNVIPKESVHSQANLNIGLASSISSELEERLDAVTSVIDLVKNESGTYACKVEAGPSGYQEAIEYNPSAEIKGEIKEHPISKKLTECVVPNTCRFGDPVVRNGKPPTSVCSDTGPKVLSYGEHVPRDSYCINQDDVDIVSRDDDENSSGYTFPRTTKKYFRPTPRVGDWRIRKILGSRLWKEAPKLKDAALCDTNDLKPAFHNRNNYYKIQRSEKIYPFKKRKCYFQCSSPSNSDGAIWTDLVDSRHSGGDGNLSGCYQKMRGGTGASSSITAENSSFRSRDSHVKLRIKSFRVPELFVDIPESATIASLKRTVLESVTAVLRGGFRVGMFLQGKKVRDDNKTLLQTGLPHSNQFDSVGFSLEPNPCQNTQSLCNGSSPFLPSCDTPQPLNRCPASPSAVDQGTLVTPPESQVNYVGNIAEGDHGSAASTVDMLINKPPMTNSKALVAVPAMNVEALAVVPAQRKLKQSEIVQRRIRRPFSVVEVEALVKAVEKLGTGRWRDVKLRSFDNAKHRTYVDLKDKWKTLVHTAKISPQQRRGEPVPQELLDRVLTAHAYWSQQQSKQLHVKHQQPETCLLL